MNTEDLGPSYFIPMLQAWTEKTGWPCKAVTAIPVTEDGVERFRVYSVECKPKDTSIPDILSVDVSPVETRLTVNSGFPATPPSDSPSQVSIRHSWAHFNPQAQRNETPDTSASIGAVRLDGSNLVIDLSRLPQAISSPAPRSFNPAAQATLTSFMHPVRNALLSPHSPGKQPVASGSSSLVNTILIPEATAAESSSAPQPKKRGRSRKQLQTETPSQPKPRAGPIKLKITPKAAVPAVFSSSSTLIPASSQVQRKASSNKAASSSSATAPVNASQPSTSDIGMTIDNPSTSNPLPSPEASTSSELSSMVSESVSTPVPSRKTSRPQKPSEKVRFALSQGPGVVDQDQRVNGKRPRESEEDGEGEDELDSSPRKQPRTTEALPSSDSSTLVESSSPKKTPRPRKIGDSVKMLSNADFSFISNTDNSESQAKWKQLVDVWSTFENVFHSLESDYNVPVRVNLVLPKSDHRPDSVAQWIKRARASTYRPHRAGCPTGMYTTSIDDIQTLLGWLDKMDTDFSQWWKDLKEAHQQISDINAAPALLCPGLNGLTNVIASLFFWAEGIREFESLTVDDASKRTEEFSKTKKSWFEEVDDVRGVLEGMLAAMKKT